MSFELVMPSNHLILCHPLLLLPSIFPSLRVFTKESVLHIRWPKYWSFSFNISPSSEYSGLVSFRMDWLALLAVQGTLKSLLQHHRSKASVQLYVYMTESLYCWNQQNLVNQPYFYKIKVKKPHQEKERYMFCFKTYKPYTLVESPTLFLSLEFNGLGLLFALCKGVMMS